MRRRRRRDR